MDLTVSPDLDAIVCYSIVLLAGLVVATVHVKGLFGNASIIWLIPQTWLLLISYTLVPLVLFWVLDRSGAINDTSFFAALIVGFGYQQIVTGSNQSIKAPGNVSAVWTPFLAWAERIAGRVRDRIQLDDQEFREYLVREAAKNEDMLQKFVAVAKGLTSDLATFKRKLDAVDAIAPEIGQENVRAQKAQLTIDEISLAPNYAKIAKARELITAKTYYWRAVHWKHTLRTGPWLLIIIAFFICCIIFFTRPKWRVEYYVWRSGKPNATKLDQFRAREQLSTYLSCNSFRDITLQCIAHQLKTPGHPMDRLNTFIGVLLQHRRDERTREQLPALFIDSLRTESVDCRARVQSALLLIARERLCSGEVPEFLAKWKPSDGDPIGSLEDYIKAWKAFFRGHPEIQQEAELDQIRRTMENAAPQTTR